MEEENEISTDAALREKAKQQRIIDDAKKRFYEAGGANHVLPSGARAIVTGLGQKARERV